MAQQRSLERPWKSSILTLYREPFLLISSILVPCGAYYKASACFEKDPADFVESLCGGCCFFCGFDLRSRFRDKYGLRGNEAEDFCIHCWCNSCGLAQIQREAQLWKEAEMQKDQPMTPTLQTIESVQDPVLQRRPPTSSMSQPITAPPLSASQGVVNPPTHSAPALYKDTSTSNVPVGPTMAAQELTELMGDITQIYDRMLQGKNGDPAIQNGDDSTSAKE